MEAATRMAAMLLPTACAVMTSTAAAIPARMSVRGLEGQEGMEALAHRVLVAFAPQEG